MIAPTGYLSGTRSIADPGFINGTGTGSWTYMPSANVNAAVVIDPADDCLWVASEFTWISAVAASEWGTHVASVCPAVADADSDGVPDSADNCSQTQNAGQPTRTATAA